MQIPFFCCKMTLMKFAILANEAQKKAFLQRSWPPQAELIWVDSLRALLITEADHYWDFLFDNDATRTSHLQSLAKQAPVWVNTVVDTEKEMGSDFIRFNGWITCIERPLLEITVYSLSQQEQVKSVMQYLQWHFQLVPDLVGMVTPRVIAMLVNEAYYTLEMEVSTPQEIDTAMRLGTNYPWGPFEWSEKIGMDNIYRLLSKLASLDKRYTVSTALTKAAGADRYSNFKWQ